MKTASSAMVSLGQPGSASLGLGPPDHTILYVARRYSRRLKLANGWPARFRRSNISHRKVGARLGREVKLSVRDPDFAGKSRELEPRQLSPAVTVRDWPIGTPSFRKHEMRCDPNFPRDKKLIPRSKHPNILDMIDVSLFRGEDDPWNVADHLKHPGSTHRN